MLEYTASVTAACTAIALGLWCALRGHRRLAILMAAEATVLAFTFAAGPGWPARAAYAATPVMCAAMVAWLASLAKPSRLRRVELVAWSIGGAWGAAAFLGRLPVAAEDVLWPLLVALILLAPLPAWRALQGDPQRGAWTWGLGLRSGAWAVWCAVALSGAAVRSSFGSVSLAELGLWVLVLLEVPVLAMLAAPAVLRLRPGDATQNHQDPPTAIRQGQ